MIRETCAFKPTLGRQRPFDVCIGIEGGARVITRTLLLSRRSC